MIGFEDTQRLEEAGVIEIEPLAYMRGRTLANAFVRSADVATPTPVEAATAPRPTPAPWSASTPSR